MDMNKEDLAEKYFREGYNCCQAVFGAFADEAGLTKEEAMKIASAFGGGFGRMREVCGACIAGVLFLSCLKGYNNPLDDDKKTNLYISVQNFMKDFEKENGSYLCKRLLNLKDGDIGSPYPETRTEDFYKNRPCVSVCRSAARLMQKIKI